MRRKRFLQVRTSQWGIDCRTGIWGLGAEMSQVPSADRSFWSMERREGGDSRPAISANDVARVQGSTPSAFIIAKVVGSDNNSASVGSSQYRSIHSRAGPERAQVALARRFPQFPVAGPAPDKKRPALGRPLKSRFPDLAKRVDIHEAHVPPTLVGLGPASMQ